MKLEKAAGDRKPSGAEFVALYNTNLINQDLTPLNHDEWRHYWPYSYPVAVDTGRDCCTARDQVFHNGWGLVCAFCRKAWIETDRL